MRNLTLTFFLAIVLHLVVGVDVANALPQCSNSSYRHNCEDTLTYADGGKYVGAFKDDKPNGQGIYTFGNGAKYVGAFKDGKRNGQGTATYADGNKYVGAYKDGKYHGQGTLTYADGRINEGIWEADKFLYAQKAPTRELKTTFSSDQQLCKWALSNDGNWETLPFLQKYVQKAKDRGLSKKNCSETSSIAEASKPLGDSLDNINLCQKSTILSEGESIRWGGTFNSYVRTAKSRGLSEQDCARILGRTTTVVASKPDLQSSQALVKRTQKALKSLLHYKYNFLCSYRSN